MAIIYTANVTSYGGRNGKVRSDDGNFEMEVRPPQPGPHDNGSSVNPEILFAAAYSACFDSALQSIIRTEKAGSIETTVKASVSLDKTDEGKYSLIAALEVSIPGVERTVATELMHMAHAKCPYSLAIKDNVDVTLTLV